MGHPPRYKTIAEKPAQGPADCRRVEALLCKKVLSANHSITEPIREAHVGRAGRRALPLGFAMWALVRLRSGRMSYSVRFFGLSVWGPRISKASPAQITRINRRGLRHLLDGWDQPCVDYFRLVTSRGCSGLTLMVMARQPENLA